MVQKNKETCKNLINCSSRIIIDDLLYLHKYFLLPHNQTPQELFTPPYLSNPVLSSETKENHKLMSNFTNQVRDYTNNASESERNSKKGQQQWGLFETHSQRQRGITTEQSLQEIENFAKRGEIQGQQVIQGQGGFSMETSGNGTVTITNEGGQQGGQGQSGGGFSMSSTTTKTFTTQGSPENRERVNKFKPNAGNQGAEFFQQVKARNAAKYAPQRKF